MPILLVLFLTAACLPLEWPTPSPTQYWSRAGYFLHRLRQLTLLVLFPVGLMVTHNSFKRFFPESAQADEFRILSLASVPLLILFAPLVIKPLLGLKSMPP